jgi:hypothetical protein
MRLTVRTSLYALALGIGSLFNSCDDKPENLKGPSFSIDIADDYIPEGQEWWYMISDEDGSLVDIKQAFAGTTIVLETPAGNENQRFTLTRFNTFKSGLGEFYGLESYTQMKPMTIKAELAPVPTGNGGEFTAEIFGLSPNDKVTVEGGGGSGGSEENQGTATIKVSLIKEKTKLLFKISNSSDPDYLVYKYVESAISPGGISLNKKDFIPMDVKVIPLDKEYSYSSAWVFHYSSDNLYVGIDEHSKEKASEFRIRYPDNTFANYNTILDITTGKEGWSYQKFGPIPSEFKKLESTVSNLSFFANKLVGDKIGDFDYLLVPLSSTYFEGNIEYSLEWAVNLSGASNNLNAVLPVIPAQLLERFPKLKLMPEKKLTHASVHEMDNIEGYDDYVTSLFGPPKNIGNANTESKSHSISFQ